MATSHYNLIVPFLDEDPKYALGVEFGIVYVKLSNLMPGEHWVDLITVENQEQLTLVCNRLGLVLAEMRETGDGWITFRVECRE